MTMYFKATRPDGTDFHTGTIDYAAALASGEVITHPAKRLRPGHASTYLSVSIAPADCTGMQWPCRLFRVEPVGDAIPGGDHPNKRCVKALRVVEELPAWQALGPNGEAEAALIERARTLTPDEARRMDAAWGAARDAARDAAWAAAWAAAMALVVRDLISAEHFETLVAPWVSGVGRTWETPVERTVGR